MTALEKAVEALEICADCGTPIQMNEASYYRRDPFGKTEIGQVFHSRCGDLFGIKVKDDEIAKLKADLAALQQSGPKLVTGDVERVLKRADEYLAHRSDHEPYYLVGDLAYVLCALTQHPSQGAGTVSEEAIAAAAQALFDRECVRIIARGGTPHHRPDTLVKHMPPSYRDDYEADARAMLTAARAILPTALPVEREGWKLVPTTLTEVMEEVAAHIADGPSVTYQEHWDAMLSAAPTPPSSGEPNKAADHIDRLEAQQAERENEIREECAKIADEWSHAQYLLLHAGEMLAQEQRTAIAVAKGIASAIRAAKRPDGQRSAAENGWQPIETAPKNGIQVLVSYKNNNGADRCAVVWWKHDCWNRATIEKGKRIISLSNATHWRPLPDPPASGEK